MKKLSFIVFITLLLVSCARPARDSYGCYRDFESAVMSGTASGSGRNIIVIATMEGSDEQSGEFLQKVVRDSGFSAVTEQYSVVLMDFSKKAYDATVAADAEDKKAVKIAAQNEEILNRNILTAKLLNISTTPSFYLLSKEGCFITNVDYIDEINSPQEFLNLLSSYQEKAETVNALIARCSSASSQEKLQAIEELYDSTESLYRPFLLDFITKAIKLASSDVNKKSKFLLARTDAQSTRAFLGGNADAAVSGYVNLAAEKNLTAEARQQAWYMAAYLLAMSDASQYEVIITYLQNAVEAAPESADAASIQRAINEISGK